MCIRDSFWPNLYHNNITKKYGIGWNDSILVDETNNDYAIWDIIIHNWANTTVAKFVSNDSTYEVEAADCALMYIPYDEFENGTIAYVYKVGIGDNDTKYGVTNDSEVTPIDYIKEEGIGLMASDIINGGRIFASGSLFLFITDRPYYYLDSKWDNKDFAMRVIHWLLAEGLEIVSIEAPEELYVGEEAYINVTIRNNENIIARGVNISIEIAGGLDLKNVSNIEELGDLGPGQEITVAWLINSTTEALSNVTIKVWCENLRGFSKVERIAVKYPSIELEVKAMPDRLYLNDTNQFVLKVTAKAPKKFDASNVWVNITLPEGVTTNNDTEYKVGSMSAGSTVVLKYYMTITGGRGIYKVSVKSSGTYAAGSLKVFSATATIRAYDIFVILDQSHEQYYDASRLYGLLEVLWDWAYVYINNETINEDILSKAKLIILPNPTNPESNATLSSSEINLLKNFVENGGAILISGTHWGKKEDGNLTYYLNATNLNELTEEYGITWGSGQILDDEVNVDDRNWHPLLSRFGESISAKILTKDVEALDFAYSTYLIVSDPADPIIYGNPSSYVNTSEGRLDISGTDIVAAAIYEDPSGGRIIALGGSYVLAYKLDENEMKFATNILRMVLGPYYWEDLEAPNISIVPPEKPYLKVRDIQITWNASDNKELSFFVIYLDGKFIDLVGSSVNTYTIRNMTDGQHVVRIYAVDIASLYAYDEITFTVDTIAPRITPITPKSGDTVYQGNITLEFDLSDETGIAYVEIYIDGVLNKTIENPGTHVATWIIIEELGDHTITIVAYDLAGNSNSVIIDITVVKRPTPGPTISPMLIIAIVIVVVIGILGYVVYARRK